MAHYALLNDNNVVTEVITGVDEDKKMIYLKNLILGKLGMEILEVKLVKELLIIQLTTLILKVELLLEAIMLV